MVWAYYFDGQYLPNSLFTTRKRRVKLIVTQNLVFLVFCSLFDSIADSIALSNKLNNNFRSTLPETQSEPHKL
jgi:hypothetical protein